MREAIWSMVVALLGWLAAEVLFPDAAAWLRQSAYLPRWGFAALGLVPTAIAWAIAKRLYSDRNPKPRSGFFSTSPAVPSASFKPSKLQHRCIVVLRSIDECHATAAQVVDLMETKAPTSDVTEALDQLAKAGWAGRQHYAIGYGATEYWLTGPGLEYARRNELDVLPSEQLGALRLKLGVHARRY